MTLIVFAVPVIPLFPLKLVGLWLLANEYWLSAASSSCSGNSSASASPRSSST
jgi:hypothetical protein